MGQCSRSEAVPATVAPQCPWISLVWDDKVASMERNVVDPACFNSHISLPYELRIDDFRLAIQDAYDFFYDVNRHLTSKGLQRLDDMLRPAIMSGVLSDMLTSSLASHARAC